jgi:tetratricopeptide (TPR) repeat protein
MSCTTKSNPSPVTALSDYEKYLTVMPTNDIQKAKQEFEFWQKKYEKAPNQSPYLIKMAAAQSQLFELTGAIEHLTLENKLLEQANEDTHFSSAGYMRALARSYITQHRFKEALQVLEKAEVNGEQLAGTQKMLFDVHLELGNTKLAEKYLSKFTNKNDFDYLIRLAKWKDHEGDLESAILYMEKATERAEYYGYDDLKVWAYTNLADFYGHAGRIEDAYQNYLRALAINPNEAYAKKGIAWIAYSHEKDTQKATDILTAIATQNESPDYYLLQAEIAEYQNDIASKDVLLEKYYTAINNEEYGDMYNKYKSTLLAEELNQTNAAVEIAEKELEQRPTPQSYVLLAWALYHNGAAEEALSVVENHVINQTFEPEAQYQMATIFKANNNSKKALELKAELLGAEFELGPVLAEKIHQL